MAHFAQLDADNTVIQVVVISNDDILDENGVEQESLGVEVCRNIFGADTSWVQTSYNNNFRKQYAGLGFKYEQSSDVFYNPNKPYPSWTLNENYDWEPPITKPNDGKQYKWDEDLLNWTEFLPSEIEM